MKSGFLTTEFWLSLGGFAAGLALIVIGATQHDKEILETGVVLMLGGSVPYAGVRAFVKSKSITGLGAATQGRANEVLGRMLDFAEQYVEKLAKPPEPVAPSDTACSLYCHPGPDDLTGPCVYCGQPHAKHSLSAQEKGRVCPEFVPGAEDGELCATCKSPRFGHAGIAQVLAPFTAIDLSEATQHLTDEDFEELIKAAKFDRNMRNTPPVPSEAPKS